MPADKIIEEKPEGETKEDKAKEDEKKFQKAIDETDIAIFKRWVRAAEASAKRRFGLGPHAMKIKAVEEENKKLVEEIKKESGVKESDTGLALPSQWNIPSDKQLLQEKPLSVAMCTKIMDKDSPNPKYLINLR